MYYYFVKLYYFKLSFLLFVCFLVYYAALPLMFFSRQSDVVHMYQILFNYVSNAKELQNIPLFCENGYYFNLTFLLFSN